LVKIFAIFFQRNSIKNNNLTHRSKKRDRTKTPFLKEKASHGFGWARKPVEAEQGQQNEEVVTGEEESQGDRGSML
jgi:hypothetical protein